MLYERKVDLPQEGSPRRRMVIVGGLSMDRDRLLVNSVSSRLAEDVESLLELFGLARYVYYKELDITVFLVGLRLLSIFYKGNQRMNDNI